jgi:hypothetical protein
MISLTKTYRTKGGHPVKIFMTDNKGDYAVVGAYQYEDGEWEPSTWTINGVYGLKYQDPDLDLIETKPRIKREGWVNVDANYTSSILCFDKREADYLSSPDRLACVQITIDCEEGEGL